MFMRALFDGCVVRRVLGPDTAKEVRGSAGCRLRLRRYARGGDERFVVGDQR